MPQYLARQEIRRESEADEVDGGVEVLAGNTRTQFWREVDGGVEVLAGKYKDPSFGVSVWRGGIVEPNLMAVFAAVWYYLKHHSEPPSDMAKSVLYLGWGPPSDMAKSVLYLGWGVSNSGCRDVASPFSNVLPALQAAADTVRLLAQARLQQMPTSIEEDEAILRELERCKSGGKAGEREKEGVKGGKLGKEGKKKVAQSKQQHKEKLTSVEERVSAKRLSRRRRRRAVSEGRISDDYSDDDNSESDNNEEEGTDADFKRQERGRGADGLRRVGERAGQRGERGGRQRGRRMGNIGRRVVTRMVAVRFRKAKKGGAERGVDRLRKVCPASPTAFL
ncbi:unnamed protein product [Closterium sp. NIES-64]|nr:unnamed protein product [Closterium sp. NIES-64]